MRRSQNLSSVLVAATTCAALLVHCGGQHSGGSSDAGHDATADAGGDVVSAVDASDAATDVAPKDAVAEGSVDASPEGGAVEAGEGGTLATVLASGSNHPSGIAVDQNNVYWATYGMAASDGTLYQLALPNGADAGAPIELATGLAQPFFVTVAGASVVFATADAVQSVPIGGGTVLTLASGQNRPFQIVTDATYAYWTSLGNGTVSRAPLSGAGPTDTLSSGLEQPKGLALAGSTLYWVSYLDGTLRSTPTTAIDAGTGTLLTTGPIDAYGVAANTSTVFWTIASGGTTDAVLSMPAAGSTATTVALNQATPEGIALDSQNLYWADSVSGNIMSAPLALTVDAGAPTVLSAGNPIGTPMDGWAQFIAIDSNYVYWTSPNAGTVSRVAK